MATKTITHDDLDPSVEATVTGIEVALGETKVRLDLSDQNHQALTSFLEPYLAAGVPVAKRGRKPAAQVVADHAVVQPA